MNSIYYDFLLVIVNFLHNLIFFGSLLSAYFIIKSLVITIYKFIDFASLHAFLTSTKQILLELGYIPNFINSVFYANLILLSQAVFNKCPLMIITNYILMNLNKKPEINDFLFGFANDSISNSITRVLIGSISLFALVVCFYKWETFYFRIPIFKKLFYTFFKSKKNHSVL